MITTSSGSIIRLSQLGIGAASTDYRERVGEVCTQGTSKLAYLMCIVD